ncbi:hypothetical protein ElyMa_004109200 [Elysia marginata]|uniref:Reverse transcriptase zinc-binding domain-containing protein n=1 Tax=Elysia marginata TaxID=1093978 RepID=A0AAV4GEN0_9GAST|nr:hypothetical protein ElyMa_004109200 [Elysia marginata]
MKESWKTRRPRHLRQDGLHQMDRTGQTTLFRLRIGHNRLKTNLYKTYNIGHTDLCSCGEASEKEEHVLQDCQNYRMLRQAAQQTCRPNSGVPLKNWKRPTASSTRRGSLFAVDIEPKREKTTLGNTKNF